MKTKLILFFAFFYCGFSFTQTNSISIKPSASITGLMNSKTSNPGNKTFSNLSLDLLLGTKNQKLFFYSGVGYNAFEGKRFIKQSLEAFSQDHDLPYPSNFENNSIDVKNYNFSSTYISIPLGIQYKIPITKKLNVIQQIGITNYFNQNSKTSLNLKSCVWESPGFGGPIIGDNIVCTRIADHPTKELFTEKYRKSISPYILELKYAIGFSSDINEKLSFGMNLHITKNLKITESIYLSSYKGVGVDFNFTQKIGNF